MGATEPSPAADREVADLLRYRSARGRWTIAACVGGSGIASLDATVVGIALPTIGRELHAGLGTLQWVSTGYTLTLAGFLLLGGSLGDRLGRRRVFSVGVAWFAVSSVLCGLAPNAEVLVLARALQGVGAALLTPGSLAILGASFRPDDRAPAIGAWSALGGVATAVGPLLGGSLLAVGSWRWVFVINLPISVVVLAITSRFVPESRSPGDGGPLDVPGGVLGVVVLGSATYAVIEAASSGWGSPSVVVAAIVGAVAAVAFVWVERRSAAPMVPFGLVAGRQFTVTNATTFVVYGALGGALFLLPVQLQTSSRYSPLASGVALLPVTVIMLVFSARSGRVASRIGPRLQMGVGPVVVGAGLALLWRVGEHARYVHDVLPAVLVFGAGLAITVAPLTATAMASVPSARSGLASAVNNDVARVAGLLAVAVLPPAVGLSGDAYLDPAALTHGFRLAVVAAALLCVLGGIVSAVGIRNPSRAEVPEGEHECLHCGLDAPPLVQATRT